MEKQRWEEPEKRREEKREKRREEKRSEAKRREEKRSEEKTREDQRREEERRPEKRKSHKEEVSVGRKGRKVVFPMICGSGGSKVGAPKQRARSHLARWEMKKCTPLWREAHVEAKMNKARHSRTTFGSCDVEEVHAVVARSTCPSQNAQSTPCSDHFWKLRCRKSAHRCGGKHMPKWKCTKHCSVGPL